MIPTMLVEGVQSSYSQHTSFFLTLSYQSLLSFRLSSWRSPKATSWNEIRKCTARITINGSKCFPLVSMRNLAKFSTSSPIKLELWHVTEWSSRYVSAVQKPMEICIIVMITQVHLQRTRENQFRWKLNPETITQLTSQSSNDLLR